MQAPSLTTIPEECTLRILQFLDPLELVSIGRTCTKLARLINEPSLWYPHFSKFPYQLPSVHPEKRREQYGKNALALRRWRQLRENSSFTSHTLQASERSIVHIEPVTIDSTPHLLTLEDGQIWIRNITTNEIRTNLAIQCDLQSVQVVYLNNLPHLVTSSSDHCLQLWDATQGTRLHNLQGHSGYIDEIQVVEKEGRFLALTRSEDWTVRLWDVKEGKPLSCIEVGGAIEELLFLSVPEGAIRLAVRIATHTIQVWDGENGEKIADLRHDPPSIIGCKEVQIDDASCLVTYGTAPYLSLWNSLTGTLITGFDGHTDSVLGVEYRREGEVDLLLSWSEDATTRLWEIASGKCIATYREPQEGAALEARFLTHSSQIVTRSANGSITLWNREGTANHITCSLSIPTKEMRPYFVGNRLQILDRPEEGPLWLWSPSQNCTTQSFAVGPTSCIEIFELQERAYILLWNSGGALQLLDGETGRRVSELEPENMAGARFVTLQDGISILAHTWAGEIRLWTPGE